MSVGREAHLEARAGRDPDAHELGTRVEIEGFLAEGRRARFDDERETSGRIKPVQARARDPDQDEDRLELVRNGP